MPTKLPTKFPARGWRQLKPDEIIRKGDVVQVSYRPKYVLAWEGLIGTKHTSWTERLFDYRRIKPTKRKGKLK